MMGACGTCRHWTPPDPDDYQASMEPDLTWEEPSVERPHHRGTCERITMIGDSARPVHKDELAHVQDGSRYIAELRTKPEFGCVLWEAK